MQSKIELAQSIEEWDLNNNDKIGLELLKSLVIWWWFAYLQTILFFLYVL